jgi:purine-binding chemotaxis protein CheW
MTAPGEMQAVLFGLGEEVFAVPVTLVREILDHRDAFRIPHGPDWLLGLIDVRGEAVPTVDLRLRLGLAPAAPTLTTRVLVVDLPLADRTLTLGLVVDRVLDVSSFAAGRVEAKPDIGVRWKSEYLRGIVRRDEGFVVLLDVAAIFEGDDDVARLLPVAA